MDWLRVAALFLCTKSPLVTRDIDLLRFRGWAYCDNDR